MQRSSSITDFFKPFAQPRQNKRSLPHDDSRESRAIRPTPGVKLEVDNAKAMGQEEQAIALEKSCGYLPAHIRDDKLNAQDVQSSGVNELFDNAKMAPNTNSPGPLGSQDPVLTSSQRVVKNGEVMIRNSEDEASDSDSSLDDIDGILASKKPAGNAVPPPDLEIPILNLEAQSGREERRRRRRTRGTASAEEPSRTPALPVMPKYIFSLDSLVMQSKNYKESDTQTAKARLLLQSLEHQEYTTADGGTSISDKGAKVDENLVASVMKQHDEDESVGRLMTAIQRTEALYQRRAWSFFDGNEDIQKLEEGEFPQIDPFNNIFEEVHSRQQAFLSGYVGEMAEKGRLPDEVLMWITDAVCAEVRDDLRHSYIYTLKEAGNQITMLLTPEHIDTLFRNVGASTEALSRNRPIVPAPILLQPDRDENDRPRLLSILYLLRDLAVFLSAESRLQAALRNIYPYTADSTLRLQLLHNIPSASPRLAAFRRQLSLAFFLHDPQYLEAQPPNLLDLRQIARYLQKPQFTIRNDTDYADLAAAISILSIGIDAGDPPPLGSNASQEAAFNADVDLLSDRIKAMFTQIVDTGASHMQRTEAKATLEAFHSRLLYAVRTKLKPKTRLVGVSDIDVGPDSRQGAMMRGFLERAVPTRDAAMPDQK